MEENIILEYITNERRNRIIMKIINKMVYNWLTSQFELWDNTIDTEKQIGHLYIGPNNCYKDDDITRKDFSEHKWGWNWRFTNDYKGIKIFYNTVKNKWLDIKEDNEVIVPVDELLNYIKN